MDLRPARPQIQPPMLASFDWAANHLSLSLFRLSGEKIKD